MNACQSCHWASPETCKACRARKAAAKGAKNGNKD